MGNIVKFHGGDELSFDAIMFATGYKSTANMWLKVLRLISEFSQVRLFLVHQPKFGKSSNQIICYLYAQNGESMLNRNGPPTKEYPNHWKGENGLYCAGLARRGLAGIAADAKNIANDIKSMTASTSC